MKNVWRALAVFAVFWVCFVAVVYSWMRQPPERFAGHMANLPLVAMMAFPFETLWSNARGGSLNVGDAAPDFDLQTVDKQSRVKLSNYRGSRPVVLVFGSYT